MNVSKEDESIADFTVPTTLCRGGDHDTAGVRARGGGEGFQRRASIAKRAGPLVRVRPNGPIFR